MSTVRDYVNGLWDISATQQLEKPNYIFTFPDLIAIKYIDPNKLADDLGYKKDNRGHRSDKIKLMSHPSHPINGDWNGNIFELSDYGMQDPNYTFFGLADGEQDPQAVITYKGSYVIPEITVTPNGNYYMNSYDNVKLFPIRENNIYKNKYSNVKLFPKYDNTK